MSFDHVLHVWFLCWSLETCPCMFWCACDAWGVIQPPNVPLLQWMTTHFTSLRMLVTLAHQIEIYCASRVILKRMGTCASEPNEGNGGQTDKYRWVQTLADVNVSIPVPEGTKSKMMDVAITKKHLKVGIKGEPPIIDVRILMVQLVWEDNVMYHGMREMFAVVATTTTRWRLDLSH